MDCRRAFAALLITGAALAAKPVAAPAIREANWIAPERRLTSLSQEPSECMVLPKVRIDRELVALGRHLFRNPLLLGGQAARAGLSCASCHRNGRGNPDFLFPGLSGAAGTADITSSLMSRTRGDSIANPMPIPDLASDVPKVSREAGDPTLQSFIRGLVVDEFDGLEPAPRSLAALAAYVRAVQPAGCRASEAKPLTLAQAVGEVVLGLSVARTEANRGDGAGARLALGGVRDRLGVIAARYAGLAKDQEAITKADKRLAKAQAAIASRPELAAKTLARWETDFAKLRDMLARDEGLSLYNRDRLSVWLSAGQKP